MMKQVVQIYRKYAHVISGAIVDLLGAQKRAPSTSGNDHKRYPRNFSIWYVIIPLVGVVFAGLTEVDKNAAIEKARERFISEAKAETARVANVVVDEFKQVYQGIRTIARLPGVRSIDRYAKSFSADARISTQEIYNNLAENVAVSEVYIVPVDFDPDKMDPQTGQMQTPIIEFDELIVGRTADNQDSKASRKSSSTKSGAAHEAHVEEIEIVEYRLMKEQISTFKRSYKTENSVRDLSYPAISGREVITCDNTRYSTTSPNDADRSGIVYSVPFFGTDGSLKGIVSAVILTRALEEMLPSGYYDLNNRAYSFHVGSKRPDATPRQLSRAGFFGAARPQIYLEEIKLPIIEVSQSWTLSSSLPNELFWQLPAVRAANDQALMRHLAILLLSIGGLYLFKLQNTQRRLVHAENAKLERRVHQRTNELNLATQEAQLANREKSEFLAKVSHEIRTPLNGIIGMAEVLARSNLENPEQDKLSKLRTSANVLLSLVNNVLDLSKIESGKCDLNVDRIDIRELVTDLVQGFVPRAKRTNIELSSNVSQRVPEDIWQDSVLLRQVLSNLIDNAIKFTPEGSVRVEVDPEPPLNKAGRDTYLRFTVNDTGIGIEPAQGDSVFGSFKQADGSITRRYGGTGLGLSISQHAVALMEGAIDYTSKVGEGSCFSFTVKLQGPESHEIEKNTHRDFETSNPLVATPLEQIGANVLLVEDNPLNQEVARSYLEHLGCNVEVAHDGRQAITSASGKRFDVILMDCQMPGMDGLEATRQIRCNEKSNASKSVPIVALTAHVSASDRQSCFDAGMDGYLSKPFSAEQLGALLLKHIRTS